MPRARSLTLSMSFTTAGRAHGCRHNEKHRLSKGDARLTIKSDGDEHHYCLFCARKFLESDISKMKNMLEQIQDLTKSSIVDTSERVL